MHFTEMKEVEILKERLSILGDIENYSGKYFSKQWIRKNVLRQTEDDIEEIDKQMEKEASEGENEEYQAPPQQEAHAAEIEPIPVVVQNESNTPHIIDDTDQKELAKSMTKFFDTLVEETRGDEKESK